MLNSNMHALHVNQVISSYECVCVVCSAQKQINIYSILCMLKYPDYLLLPKG